MSTNPLDTSPGTELFSSYEAEYRLVHADLTQKLDLLPDLSGEPRKAALSSASLALDELSSLLSQMQLEKQNIPSTQRTKPNQRLRNYTTDIDAFKRRLQALASDRGALFSSRRYQDDPDAAGGPSDVQLEQRQQLLSGTDRLDRSSQRLRASQALANETEAIGASTLADLHVQGERIRHTTDVLLESET